jgi:hypothetical protein
MAFHARNQTRATSLHAFVDGGGELVIGDLVDREAMQGTAAEPRAREKLDAVICAAGFSTDGRSAIPNRSTFAVAAKKNSAVVNTQIFSPSLYQLCHLPSSG